MSSEQWRNFLAARGLKSSEAGRLWEDLTESQKREYTFPAKKGDARILRSVAPTPQAAAEAARAARDAKLAAAAASVADDDANEAKASDDTELARGGAIEWTSVEAPESSVVRMGSSNNSVVRMGSSNNSVVINSGNNSVVINSGSGSVVADPASSVVFAPKKSGAPRSFVINYNAYAGAVAQAGDVKRHFSRPFQVSAEDYAKFQTWRKSHPVLPLSLPPFGAAQWIEITAGDKASPALSSGSNSVIASNRGRAAKSKSDSNVSTQEEVEQLQVYVPRTFSIGNVAYTLMSLFPGSRTRRSFAGSFGVVVAYQALTTDQIVVLKASLLPDEAQGVNLEQEAFEILHYLEDSGNVEGSCGERFVHLVAGDTCATAPGKPRQALVVLERMDMTLQDLADDKPHLFRRVSSVREIFRSVAESLACMHRAKPKPVPHGDLKPANLLCSPYIDAWLDVLEKDGVEKRNFTYAKMADFDGALTTVWDLEQNADSSYRGTTLVMSPQRLKDLIGNRHVRQSQTDDIWALGMCMLLLCDKESGDDVYSFSVLLLSDKDAGNLRFGLSEFTALRLQQYVETQLRILRQKWKRTWTNTPDKLQGVSALLDLLRQCLTVDVTKRATIDTVLSHVFFTQTTPRTSDDDA